MRHLLQKLHGMRLYLTWNFIGLGQNHGETTVRVLRLEEQDFLSTSISFCLSFGKFYGRAELMRQLRTRAVEHDHDCVNELRDEICSNNRLNRTSWSRHGNISTRGFVSTQSSKLPSKQDGSMMSSPSDITVHSVSTRRSGGSTTPVSGMTRYNKPFDQ
jgi:hypothetical protein